MAERVWTPKLVAERLEEAAETMRGLPPAIMRPKLCSWPEIIRDASESYGWSADRVRSGPPSAAAIDRLDETLEWFLWLEPEESRLVWARAVGTRWKVIAYRLGVDRTTVWRRWTYALVKIAAHLNAHHRPGLLQHFGARQNSGFAISK